MDLPQSELLLARCDDSAEFDDAGVDQQESFDDDPRYTVVFMFICTTLFKKRTHNRTSITFMREGCAQCLLKPTAGEYFALNN